MRQLVGLESRSLADKICANIGGRTTLNGLQVTKGRCESSKSLLLGTTIDKYHGHVRIGHARLVARIEEMPRSKSGSIGWNE